MRETLLTDVEVGAMLGGVSRTTVWNHVKRGIIPAPIKLGGISRWPMSEINAVIEKAKEQR